METKTIKYQLEKKKKLSVLLCMLWVLSWSRTSRGWRSVIDCYFIFIYHPNAELAFDYANYSLVCLKLKGRYYLIYFLHSHYYSVSEETGSAVPHVFFHGMAWLWLSHFKNYSTSAFKYCLHHILLQIGRSLSNWIFSSSPRTRMRLMSGGRLKAHWQDFFRIKMNKNMHD